MLLPYNTSFDLCTKAKSYSYSLNYIDSDHNHHELLSEVDVSKVSHAKYLERVLQFHLGIEDQAVSKENKG